jgi:hypothetical protein
MRDEVEHARHRRQRPDADEHEPELADRRVGEDPLQVKLPQRDRGREQRRERADGGDGPHGGFVGDEQRAAAHDHVHARRHHGGGVDQRADGRGAFHGVREPDVQRELRALAERAEHQQERDPLHRVALERRVLRELARLLEQPVVLGGGAQVADRPERGEAEHDA